MLSHHNRLFSCAGNIIDSFPQASFTAGSRKLARHCTFVFLLALLTCMAGCVKQAQPALTASDAFVRLPVPGQSKTAGYLRLDNGSADTVTVVGASSPIAASVEIHEHIHAHGKMLMQKVDRLELGAGESAVFRSGGLHLMFFGVNIPEGTQSTTLQFTLADGSTLDIAADIRSVLE